MKTHSSKWTNSFTLNAIYLFIFLKKETELDWIWFAWRFNENWYPVSTCLANIRTEMFDMYMEMNLL